MWKSSTCRCNPCMSSMHQQLVTHSMELCAAAWTQPTQSSGPLESKDKNIQGKNKEAEEKK